MISLLRPSAALLLAIALFPLHASAQGAQTPWPDEQGMVQRLAACAACHGSRGEGAPGAEYFPHLAGKPAGYLFAQMQGFRDGRRHYPQMVYLMRNWNDAWLSRIALFYAAQPIPELHSQAAGKLDAQGAARANTLVREGDAQAGLPPCAACHGEKLEGLEPGIPALAGLPMDYLIAQLGGWLTGARHSLAPDCMAQIVSKLQPGDIRLVATYLSALPATPEDRPAPEGSREPPLACGGIGQFDAAPQASP
ncbi:MAG: cytochrome c4 [Lysobacteraceae bacterium]